MLYQKETIVLQTKTWLKDVVIGHNFCPFAAKEYLQGSIHYRVADGQIVEDYLQTVLEELERLDTDHTIETTLIIFPSGLEDFEEYLDLVDIAEVLIEEAGYEGIYQIASFHPLYLFEDSDENDAANYTNRSLYPMLHILREESITKALENYPDADNIPKRNIAYTRAKGIAFMKILREACLRSGN